MRPSIHQSVSQSVSPSVSQSAIHLAVHPSICLSVHQNFDHIKCLLYYWDYGLIIIGPQCMQRVKTTWKYFVPPLFCILGMPRKFNQVLAAIVPQLKDEPQHLDECIRHLKYQESNIIYNHVHYNIKISSQIKPEHLKSSSREVRKILLGMKIFNINKKVKNVQVILPLMCGWPFPFWARRSGWVLWYIESTFLFA